MTHLWRTGLSGLLIGGWLCSGGGMANPTPAPFHPVLLEWQAPETIVDYRDQIQPTPVGYLRWQQFPVRVAIEPAANTPEDAGSERDRRWVAAIRAALGDWQPYFPLVEVAAAGEATGDWDIYVLRSRPPAQRLRDGTILPARFADARYELLPSEAASPVKFRFRIRIGNQQGEEGLRATARHELGHALGLWGHSTDPQDVMYPAQIGLYPPISDRDLKTLQWLYNLMSN